MGFGHASKPRATKSCGTQTHKRIQARRRRIRSPTSAGRHPRSATISRRPITDSSYPSTNTCPSNTAGSNTNSRANVGDTTSRTAGTDQIRDSTNTTGIEWSTEGADGPECSGLPSIRRALGGRSNKLYHAQRTGPSSVVGDLSSPQPQSSPQPFRCFATTSIRPPIREHVLATVG
jgi:hypothetical protein